MAALDLAIALFLPLAGLYIGWLIWGWKASFWKEAAQAYAQSSRNWQEISAWHWQLHAVTSLCIYLDRYNDAQ